MAIVTDCELRPDMAMSRSRNDVAKRLELTRRALNLSAADLCRETGIKPNQWSQYVSLEGNRRISLQAAFRLTDTYKIPIGWIFDGDMSQLPDSVRKALRKAA